jgi:hypothetical protein
MFVELEFNTKVSATKVYGALYHVILMLIARVDAHEYHGALFRQLLKDIAQEGR